MTQSFPNIRRSTTCDDLGLSIAARCDGCVRRNGKTEIQCQTRTYKCKRYFSEEFNPKKKPGKRGKNQKEKGYDRAWKELETKGYQPLEEWVNVDKHRQEPKPQPRRWHAKMAEAEATTRVQNEKATATLSEITVQQTRQQTIEAFIDKSCKHDVVMLIDKLFYAAGHDEQSSKRKQTYQDPSR